MSKSSVDFEVGHVHHEQETELRIAVPNRDEAWRIVKNILKQLEEEDDGCSGVAIILHGKVLGQD